jgi:hypothetical protein
VPPPAKAKGPKLEGDAEAAIKKVFKNAARVTASCEKENPDPEYISESCAKGVSKVFHDNKAWDVANYNVPKIINKDGSVSYKIADIQAAFKARYNQEKEIKTLGCETTCGNAGSFVTKGGTVYCKDDILDKDEAWAANIGGDYLFDMGQGEPKNPGFTGKGDEQNSDP